MSGGRFDYVQYRFADVADDIERLISKNGVKRTDKEVIKENPWINSYDKDIIEDYRYAYEYPKEVIEKFKEGVEVIKKAQIYAQRIDWLLSGDDGEDSFLIRLEEDLKELNK